MKLLSKFAMIAVTLVSASACGDQQKARPATASDFSQTSLCLVMQVIPFAIAPNVAVDDAGNQFDTDTTVERLMEHNAKLRAACP